MKKRKVKIFGKLFTTVVIIIAIFAVGYFSLDKLVIPKYFGNYGISGFPDLVGVVTSLYKSPKESKFITNGYTAVDLSGAVGKLQSAQYKIEDDGTIKKENITSFKGDGTVTLTDKEFAAISNKLIENGMLTDALPNLNFLNVLNVSVLQVIITPDEESIDANDRYDSAEISFIAKIETDDIREQIALQMQTPEFLLNMIIPDVLYFEVVYDFDLAKNENERIKNALIAINGRTSEQSEILINLLIDFIFPADEQMDLQKFTSEVGKIALEAVDALGEFKFVTNAEPNQNGIYIYA